MDEVHHDIAPPGAEGDTTSAFHLSDEDISHILQAVRAQDSDTVHESLSDLSPADVAELIGKVSDEDRRELLAMYGDSIDPQAFVEMDYDLRRLALSSMPAAQVATLIARLESDDALDMIINLDDDFRRDIVRKLSARLRLALEEGLSYPEESAGRLMQREFVAIPQFWTVGKTIDYLREAAGDLPEDFFDIFVITPTYNIVGHVPLSKVVCSKRSVKIESLKFDQTHSIPATMDQEEVAQIFRRDNITSAPVVDENKRLIGVITIDDVIDVIDEEAQEDLLKMAGVRSQGDLHRSAFSTSSMRFGWLFINLGTAFLDTAVISLFDDAISKIVVLAALMPVIASMGGNAGTQTLGVVIRLMALNELSSANLGRFIVKEVLVGTINGLWFAVILGVAGALWYQSPLLGVALAGASVIEHIVAGLAGVAIPVILKKMGSDPAVSSVIFLTTITDVVAFFSFLGLATLLLLH